MYFLIKNINHFSRIKMCIIMDYLIFDQTKENWIKMDLYFKQYKFSNFLKSILNLF